VAVDVVDVDVDVDADVDADADADADVDVDVDVGIDVDVADVEKRGHMKRVLTTAKGRRVPVRTCNDARAPWPKRFMSRAVDWRRSIFCGYECRYSDRFSHLG
jgi:hypothetical protein